MYKRKEKDIDNETLLYSYHLNSGYLYNVSFYKHESGKEISFFINDNYRGITRFYTFISAARYFFSIIDRHEKYKIPEIIFRHCKE